MAISFRGNLANNRGQSLVEYMLILVVAVAIILILVFQFSSAFQIWANNYFGEYLQCLLETGELPSIGGTPGDSGTCNQFFSPFNLQNGRASIAAPNAGGNGSNASKGGRARGEVPSNARRNGGGGGGRGGSRGGDGKWHQTETEPPRQAQEEKGDEESKHGEARFSSTSGGGSRTSSYKADNGRFIDGRVGGSQRETDNKDKASPKVKTNDLYRTAKKFKLKRPPKKEEVTADVEPYSFADFFRMLVIAAIIIALVVLLGGQVLQIGKSMDAE